MALEKPTGVPDMIPTCTCFDDVFEFFPASHVPLNEVHVVHGMCRGHAQGTLYAHGWIEHGDTVWQSAIMRATGELVFFGLTRDAFREIFAVQRSTRYTLSTLLMLTRQHGYCGPWRKEYLELCGGDGDGAGGRVVGMIRGAAPIAIIHTGQQYADIEIERDKFLLAHRRDAE